MRKFVVFLFLGALIASGCGKQNSADSTATPKPASGPTDAEIPVSLNDNEQVVQITADDTMHYNGNRFTVHAGQPVRIELTSKGTRPITEMAHNFVLLKPGVDELSFNFACAQAKESGYMPASQADKVIAFTALAGPGQTVTVGFTMPTAGSYSFLCNFPGHYAAGMHGTMTVVP